VVSKSRRVSEQVHSDGRLWMKADMSKMTGMMDTVVRERVGMNRVIWELCDGFDTVKWRGLDGHTKMEWLKELVEEACRREFEDEMGERNGIGLGEQMVILSK
jgi:hypothetical protein